MIQVCEVNDHRMYVVISGQHEIVMDGIARQGGMDAADVIGHALNMVLRHDKHNLLLKGIANVMERENGGLGRR